MQQIVASIRLRNEDKNRERKQEYSWMVSSITYFIAAGYQTENNSEAINAASELTIDEIALKIKDANLDPDPIEPKRGSTEKLKTAFSRMVG